MVALAELIEMMELAKERAHRETPALDRALEECRQAREVDKKVGTLIATAIEKEQYDEVLRLATKTYPRDRAFESTRKALEGGTAPN